MSLVDSDHIAPTHIKQDCHYFIGAGHKPAMKIWQRGEVMGEKKDLICNKCLYIPFYYGIEECPRCGEKFDKELNENKEQKE